jgi:hypothetical protein
MCSRAGDDIDISTMKESRLERERRYDRVAAEYRARPRAYDSCRALRGVFIRLKADLADAHDDLDAPSRTAWPSDSDECPALLTLGGQLGLLYDRAAALAPAYFAAEVLRRRVARLLGLDGFVAPLTIEPRHVRPPRAVGLAIARLRDAGLLPITDDRVPRDPSLARDQRLLIWFLEQLG